MDDGPGKQTGMAGRGDVGRRCRRSLHGVARGMVAWYAWQGVYQQCRALFNLASCRSSMEPAGVNEFRIGR
jgi:hypothetical protein